MKRVILTLAMILGVSALALAFYVALLASPVLNGIDILFYRGVLLCGMVSTAIMIALLSLRWQGRVCDPVLAVAVAAISFSINLSYLIVIPVTIDRSISVFLLSNIGDEADGLSVPQLQQHFVSQYVFDMKQIERRVAEQQLSGNIQLKDGRIRLTRRGRSFLAFARSQSRLIGTDPRFVGLAPPSRAEQHP